MLILLNKELAVSIKVRIYDQYDYDYDEPYYEARVKVPNVDDCFLLEPPNQSAALTTFVGRGATAEIATSNLIKKLEANAKTLQAIADNLKE